MNLGGLMLPSADFACATILVTYRDGVDDARTGIWLN